MKVKISRVAHFNAAHRLYNPKWSEEENERVFGLCANPNYHGHNYELIVSVEGEIDPKTGFVMDMKLLKTLISEHIEKPFDHKNLNLEVPEFKNLNPTAENIAVVIWKRLRSELSLKLQLEVVVYETPRNFVTYSGG
ncbi:MAG: 6-carboxytetrahydropterin synthase [Capnocytophaga felis]|nr:6-carboxytetrahydropterin synthase [Capnocytophaga felis]